MTLWHIYNYVDVDYTLSGCQQCLTEIYEHIVHNNSVLIKIVTFAILHTYICVSVNLSICTYTPCVFILSYPMSLT